MLVFLVYVTRVSLVHCCCHGLDYWHRTGTSGDLQSGSPSAVTTGPYVLEKLKIGGGTLHRKPNFPCRSPTVIWYYHLNYKNNQYPCGHVQPITFLQLITNQPCLAQLLERGKRWVCLGLHPTLHPYVESAMLSSVLWNPPWWVLWSASATDTLFWGTFLSDFLD